MTLKSLVLMSVLAFAAIFTVVEDAEAKRRLGSGTNRGVQRESVTPSSPASPTAPSAAPRSTGPATAPATPGRNWMGIAGGLLAGTLLGSLLFGNGAFGSMMGFLLNMLILGAIIYFVIRFFKNRSSGGAPEPALAGASAGGTMPAPSASPVPAPAAAPAARTATGRIATPQIGSALNGSVTSDAVAAVESQPVARRIPPDFDVAPFVREAKKSFMLLQAANDRGDVTMLRNFLTVELSRELAPEIMKNVGSNQHVEVLELNATVLEVVQDQPDRWVASVHFSGLIREEAGAAAEPFDEVWHVFKPAAGGSWLVGGIQQIETPSNKSDSLAFEKVAFGNQSGAR